MNGQEFQVKHMDLQYPDLEESLFIFLSLSHIVIFSTPRITLIE